MKPTATPELIAAALDILQQLADVYTVETDQIALVSLVYRAKQALRDAQAQTPTSDLADALFNYAVTLNRINAKVGGGR